MMKVKKVLLVDDDDTFIFLASTSINKLELNISIETFSDGQKAINYLKLSADSDENIPELIFVDINMPYLDGWGFFNEFLKLKSEFKKEVIVYLVSSSDDPIDLDKAKELENEIGYLVKPVSKSDFLQIIELYPEKFNKEIQ